MILFQNWTKH